MSARVWYLLGRKLADEATLDEIRELEMILLDDPDIAAKVEIHTNFFKLNNKPSLSKDEIAAAWKKQEEKMSGIVNEKELYVKHVALPEEPVKISRSWHKLAIAASLLLIVVLVWFSIQRKQYLPQAGQLVAVPVNEIQSTNDKLKTVLPDGSQVWLNKDSKVFFDKEFGKSNREVTLSGEAFFDVVHKAELPMIIHAGKVQIRVKGTAFNVKAYPGDVRLETALIRGSVELYTVINNHPEKILMKPNEKVVIENDAGKPSKELLPGTEQAKQPFKLEKLAVEAQSGLIPEVAWIQNKLVFNNETFEELSNKMGRWYNVEVIVKDSTLLQERFTGSFQYENLREALSALEYTYRFKYKIEGNQVYLSK